jgi:hypothetical protein
MTQAKAIAVATAIINQGFNAYAYLKPDLVTWAVRAKANDFSVDVAAAHTLATNQAVTGLIGEIEYT